MKEIIEMTEEDILNFSVILFNIVLELGDKEVNVSLSNYLFNLAASLLNDKFITLKEYLDSKSENLRFNYANSPCGTHNHMEDINNEN